LALAMDNSYIGLFAHKKNVIAVKKVNFSKKSCFISANSFGPYPLGANVGTADLALTVKP